MREGNIAGSFVQQRPVIPVLERARKRGRTNRDGPRFRGESARNEIGTSSCPRFREAVLSADVTNAPAFLSSAGCFDVSGGFGLEPTVEVWPPRTLYADGTEISSGSLNQLLSCPEGGPRRPARVP